MRIEIYDRKTGKGKTPQNQTLTRSKDPKTITTCQETEDQNQDACNRDTSCTKY